MRHVFIRNSENPPGCSSEPGIYKVVPPSDVSWFINPMNTIDISTINHSEIGVMFTNLANYGAPPCTNYKQHVLLDPARKTDMLGDAWDVS